MYGALQWLGINATPAQVLLFVTALDTDENGKVDRHEFFDRFAAKCKAHCVFVTSDKQVSGKLSAVSCPALVMTGERDAGSTPEMAMDIARQISDSDLRVMDGQHHMMTMLDSDRVNREIMIFLEYVFNGEK